MAQGAVRQTHLVDSEITTLSELVNPVAGCMFTCTLKVDYTLPLYIVILTPTPAEAMTYS